MRRILLSVLLIVGCVAMLQTSARATAISPSLTITSGDKIFNGFTCNVLVQGTGTPTTCAGIDVTAHNDAFGNIGLQFQINGNVSTINSAVDILIGYNVTSTGGLISDIHLGFNGAVTGSGFTGVTETVSGLIPATGIIGQVTVTNPPMNLDQAINLSQFVQEAAVMKDVNYGVAGTTGSATVSFVDQYVSQVPEPASMLLLGTGLVGLAGTLRRKFRQ